MLSAKEKKDLDDVLSYIETKIKDGFPFKKVEVAGAPELDEDNTMIGIAACDGKAYSFAIPNDDPRPVLQPMMAIVIEAE